MLCKLYVLFFDILWYFQQAFHHFLQNHVLANLLFLTIGSGCFANVLIQLLSRGIQVRCWEEVCACEVYVMILVTLGGVDRPLQRQRGSLAAAGILHLPALPAPLPPPLL